MKELKENVMKKRVLTVLIFAMTMLLAGCGNKEEETKDNTASSSESINPEDYVKLGNLEGLEVTVEVAGEVTDEEIEKQITDELNYYVEYADLYEYEVVEDKTVVEDGDVVNIDYEGVKGEEAFDGGTAKGAYLTIGSGRFIEGFESGLIGHSVGENVDLNLTFPEDYQSEELAGQAVVFHVKINSIHDAEKKKVPEFNDEFIKKLNFGFSTMDEYKADVKSYIQQQNDSQNETAIDDAIWEAVYGACEVSEPPQELVDEIKARVYENGKNYAAQSGMEFSEFIQNNMNMTEEEFEAEANTVSIQSAKEKLVMKAIAKNQGIEISKKLINETAATEYEQYGYESAEAYLEAVGGEAVYKDYLLSQKVDEYLKSVITVHKVEKQDSVSENSTENVEATVSSNDSNETEE